MADESEWIWQLSIHPTGSMKQWCRKAACKSNWIALICIIIYIYRSIWCHWLTEHWRSMLQYIILFLIHANTFQAILMLYFVLNHNIFMNFLKSNIFALLKPILLLYNFVKILKPTKVGNKLVIDVVSTTLKNEKQRLLQLNPSCTSAQQSGMGKAESTMARSLAKKPVLNVISLLRYGEFGTAASCCWRMLLVILCIGCYRFRKTQNSKKMFTISHLNEAV